MNTSETKYNGWTNHATWCVNLWISNDEGTYRMLQEMAQEAYDNAEPDGLFSKLENAVFDLAEALENWVDENNPLQDSCSMYSDLLQSALCDVNYHEIAESALEEVTA